MGDFLDLLNNLENELTLAETAHVERNEPLYLDPDIESDPHCFRVISSLQKLDGKLLTDSEDAIPNQRVLRKLRLHYEHLRAFYKDNKENLIDGLVELLLPQNKSPFSPEKMKDVQIQSFNVKLKPFPNRIRAYLDGLHNLVVPLDGVSIRIPSTVRTLPESIEFEGDDGAVCQALRQDRKRQINTFIYHLVYDMERLEDAVIAAITSPDISFATAIASVTKDQNVLKTLTRVLLMNSMFDHFLRMTALACSDVLVPRATKHSVDFAALKHLIGFQPSEEESFREAFEASLALVRRSDGVQKYILKAAIVEFLNCDATGAIALAGLIELVVRPICVSYQEEVDRIKRSAMNGDGRRVEVEDLKQMVREILGWKPVIRMEKEGSDEDWSVLYNFMQRNPGRILEIILYQNNCSSYSSSLRRAALLLLQMS